MTGTLWPRRSTMPTHPLNHAASMASGNEEWISSTRSTWMTKVVPATSTTTSFVLGFICSAP